MQGLAISLTKPPLIELFVVIQSLGHIGSSPKPGGLKPISSLWWTVRFPTYDLSMTYPLIGIQLTREVTNEHIKIITHYMYLALLTSLSTPTLEDIIILIFP